MRRSFVVPGLILLALASGLGLAWWLWPPSSQPDGGAPVVVAGPARDVAVLAGSPRSAEPSSAAGAGAGDPRDASAGGAAAPRSPTKPGSGEVLVRGAWGSAPGQFGRKRDPESNPEMPMALVAGAPGQVALLDQVNRRVARYQNGKLVNTLAVGADTLQDLAIGPRGEVALLDRLGERQIKIFDSDGKLKNEVPLTGIHARAGADSSRLVEPGGITGLFFDGSGIYVESEHASLVRVVGVDGLADAQHAELAGRPTRDGRLLVSATRQGNPAAGIVAVSAVDRATGAARWTRSVEVGLPVVHLVLLDSDRAGRVYVGADVARESPEPPFRLVDEHIVVVRLDGDGTPGARLVIPALLEADESFRPVSVDDDGAVVVMRPLPDGLEILRYAFP